jgi:hypothetical protein
MAVNFAEEISLSYSVGLFNMPSNLTTWGKRFYFPSEGELRTFIALKNLSSSAGFELANLGSNASTINTRPRMSTTDGFGRVPLECIADLLGFLSSTLSRAPPGCLWTPSVARNLSHQTLTLFVCDTSPPCSRWQVLCTAIKYLFSAYHTTTCAENTSFYK